MKTIINQITKIPTVQLEIALKDCLKQFEIESPPERQENARVEIKQIMAELKRRGVDADELKDFGFNQTRKKKKYRGHFGLVKSEIAGKHHDTKPTTPVM